jgi:extracellular factor (EF) 3-hydroxypalmitic acid methyl ester biosynthesis protein
MGRCGLVLARNGHPTRSRLLRVLRPLIFRGHLFGSARTKHAPPHTHRLMHGVDEAFELASAGWVREGMDHLSTSLWCLRRALPAQDWKQLCQTELLNHPMRTIAHRCPIALRSFEKPRGYAGDAVILDYIYGIFSGESHAPTAQERPCFDSRFGAPAARAVRFRRELMATLVREARKSKANAKVLSIASGHLREADLVLEPSATGQPWWVAFDQDKLSLDVVKKTYGDRGVSTLSGSVREALSGKIQLGVHDLVYAAGLFDYLPEPAAIALLKQMIASTLSGGTIMIANFARDIPDVGYMESYMAWDLIYRDESDIQRIINTASEYRVRDVNIFFDPDRNIIFAVLKVK